jgi:hypothetical protein
MPDKPKTTGDDHVGLAIFFVLIGLGVLFATPVPFVVALIVGAVARLFGVRFASFAALAIGAVAVWVAYKSGQTTSFLAGLVKSFWVDLSQPDWAQQIATAWLGKIADPTAWKITSPVGLLAGGVFLLLREDHRNSPEAQVTGKNRRYSPTIWNRFRYWLVLKGPLPTGSAITLGADIRTGRRIGITLKELSRHLLVVGRSGLGKTETILTVTSGAASNSIPIVYVDGKNDPIVREALASFAAKNGRPFYCLDAMHPERSCCYDAFAHKNVTAQTDMLLALRPEWSEPHYKAIAGARSQTIFRTLKHAEIEPDPHQLIRNLSSASLLALARRRKGKPGSYQKLVAEITRRRQDEKAATESLTSEISLLTDSFFRDSFDIQAARISNKPILRLKDARESQAIVYFGLPALPYPDAAKRLASLVIGDLRATLPEATSQWLIVLDEFSVFTTDNVLNVVNMGRSFGGCAVLGTQSCADLSAVSDAFLRQIVGSTNSFVFHELTDPLDAEYAAAMIGTETAVDFTAQIVNGAMSGSASARSVHNFKVHPDNLKRMGVGEALVFNKDAPERLCIAKIRRARS